MKRLNTSHNEISFNGILQPLLETFSGTNQKGHLVGKEVAISKDDVQVFLAIDSDKDIHLLISPPDGDDGRLSNLNFQGLKIENREWSVAEKPLQTYLDITCHTGKFPSFKRPFLRFAEDILLEISNSNVDVTDAVYKTGIRWRRFWSPEPSSSVTTEWIHGLYGELSFLLEVIKKFGPSVIYSWEGPLGSDHDFQAGTEIALEVKTSTEMPFKLHCNIRQFDSKIFKKLYLACYRLTRSQKGDTIVDLVKKIENFIIEDEQVLDTFFERLSAAGYRKDKENEYKEVILSSSPVAIFSIDESFPKLTEASFKDSIDARISNIRYQLQLTDVEEVTFDSIADVLSLLSNN